MKKDKDFLSPDFSSSGLEKSGVRRVNNLPLLLVLGIVMLFALVIAMVAVKRANLQEETRQDSKDAQTQVESSSSLNLAKEVIGERGHGVIPTDQQAPKTRDGSIVLPVAVVDNPNVPPLPPRLKADMEAMDTELERIRQDKIQQFEEAVKAKTAIEMTSSIAPQHQIDANPPSVRGIETVSSQALTGLQNGQYAQGSKPSALTLGGTEDEERWVLHSKVASPPSPYVLRAGSVIPGAMISGIRSELPGQITGQVTQNVYDTPTGKYLLIPQGTQLLGLYSSDVLYGQNTLLVAWQRLRFPDGRTLDLGSMPGTDSAGMAGFRDQVNHHYVRIFGSALLMSGIVAGITYSQNQSTANGPYNQPTAGNVLSQALGQQLGEVTAQMIAKNINIAPDLNIGSGYPFNVMVTKDLVFQKPYRHFDN